MTIWQYDSKNGIVIIVMYCHPDNKWQYDNRTIMTNMTIMTIWQYDSYDNNDNDQSQLIFQIDYLFYKLHLGHWRITNNNKWTRFEWNWYWSLSYCHVVIIVIIFILSLLSHCHIVILLSGWQYMTIMTIVFLLSYCHIVILS